MEPEVKPEVAHFSLSRGRAQELSPFLGVFDQGWPALYVLAEPVAGEEDCQELVEVVADTLAGWSLSLTSGLRAAFREAQGKLAGERQVGLVCLALKEGRLYGALAGPPQAYVFTLGRLHRLGAEEVPPPLGSAPEPRLQFWSYSPGEGDVVLLAQSTLARLLSREALRVILGSGITSAAQRLYYLAEDEPHCAVLLLSFPARPSSL